MKRVFVHRNYSGASEKLMNGKLDDEAIGLSSEMVQSHLSLALSFLGNMVKLGYAPVIVTLSSLLNDRNRVSEMEYEPNLEIYNNVTVSLCKSRYMSDALQVFYQMEQKGIRPSVVTYNSLIRGLCKSGRSNEAAELLSDMMTKKIVPNMITFNGLIHACVKKGNVIEAKEFYKEMIRISIDLDIRIYNSLVNGFSMHGPLDLKRRKK